MKDKDSRWEEFKSQHKTPNEGAWINNLAIRSFRDTGDQDYIAARMAMRARLPVQFLWSGLQAVEKYLKCMLLLNRVSSKDIGHDIKRGMEKVNDNLPFNIQLPEDEARVFQHLAGSEGDRYLTMSLYLFEAELTALDALVWRLRQYCDPLDVVHYNDTPSKDLLEKNTAVIHERLNSEGSPERGYLKFGLLEKVLDNKKHPAHESLVWQNAMFGGNPPIQPEDGIGSFMAINSPLYLNPQIVRAVGELIYLPKAKQTIKEFEKLADQREAAKKKP